VRPKARASVTADLLGDLFVSSNQYSNVTALSMAGTAVYLSGQQVAQLQLGNNGAQGITSLAANANIFGTNAAVRHRCAPW
jgi:hypothetical protein